MEVENVGIKILHVVNEDSEDVEHIPNNHTRIIDSKTEDYLKKCLNVHGNTYDYSLVNYINSKTNVTIICKIHGEFLKNPLYHLKPSGCPKCSGVYRYTPNEWLEAVKIIHNNEYDYSKTIYTKSSEKLIIICKTHGEYKTVARNHFQGQKCLKCVGGYRYSQQEWILEANRVHNNKYNYDETNYVNYSTKVIIICPIHKNFKKSPYRHLKGEGCNQCNGYLYPTTENWVTHCSKIHNNFYNYSEVVYKDQKSKVTIICPVHKKFDQVAKYHYRGSGCKKCFLDSTCLTQKQWIEKCQELHKNKYDYSKSVYTKASAKITIICPHHGPYSSAAILHINGHGCNACYRSPITTESFILKAKKIHGNLYDYSQTNYTGCYNDVTIICRDHGPFKRRACYHLNYGKCSKCNLCPSCFLFRTKGLLCSYCKPKSQNKLYQKTKEMKVVLFLRENLPNEDFIHNKSVSKDCTDGHLFPDIRFDCIYYQVIIEVDEFKHRGANYECDEKRMYDIIAKLGQPCIFIRYNPDSKKSNLSSLLDTVNKYLNVDVEDTVWDDYGFKVLYLFY